MRIAELRPAIRHSCTLTDVAFEDGEAALVWFATAFYRAGLTGHPPTSRHHEPHAI